MTMQRGPRQLQSGGARIMTRISQSGQAGYFALAADTVDPPTPRFATPNLPDPGRTPVSLNVVRPFFMFFDFVAFLAAGLMASLINGRSAGNTTVGLEFLSTLAACAVGLYCLHLMRAWAPKRLRRLKLRYLLILCAVGFGFLTILACFALIPADRVSRSYWPAYWVCGAILATGALQLALAAQMARWLERGRLLRRIAVVGLNAMSATFLSRIERHGGYEVEVAGLFTDGHDPGSTSRFQNHDVLGTIDDLVMRGRSERIDVVVLAIPLTQPDRIAGAKAALRSMVSEIYLTAGLAGQLFRSSDITDFGSVPILKVASCPLSPWQSFQKSVMDRTIAVAAVVCLAPLMAVLALAIKLDSRGPVLFRQPRLGFNNVVFTVYKFRTMYHDKADLFADAQTARNDARITRIGRWLRRFSLDELPQLLNVLEGSMSLVGPRPHAPNTKAGNTLFHDAVAEYALRHRVLPGITGWAQVNGWRGETATLVQIEQRVLHDLFYIDAWSLTFDLRILFLTVLREINSPTAF